MATPWTWQSEDGCSDPEACEHAIQQCRHHLRSPHSKRVPAGGSGGGAPAGRGAASRGPHGRAQLPPGGAGAPWSSGQAAGLALLRLGELLPPTGGGQAGQGGRGPLTSHVGRCWLQCTSPSRLQVAQGCCSAQGHRRRSAGRSRSKPSNRRGSRVSGSLPVAPPAVPPAQHGLHGELGPKSGRPSAIQHYRHCDQAPLYRLSLALACLLQPPRIVTASPSLAAAKRRTGASPTPNRQLPAPARSRWGAQLCPGRAAAIACIRSACRRCLGALPGSPNPPCCSCSLQLVPWVCPSPNPSPARRSRRGRRSRCAPPAACWGGAGVASCMSAIQHAVAVLFW